MLLASPLRKLGKIASRPTQRRRKSGSCGSFINTLEALEQRVLLTSTLFIDFGQGFAGGQLQMTVQQMLDIAGANNGPDLRNDAQNNAVFNLADMLTLSPTDAFDLNGDGMNNAADVTIFANNIVNVANRILQPFDINVVIAAATAIGDVATTLAANGNGVNNRDAYVFATEMIGGPMNVGVGAALGLNGRASGTDLNGPAANGNQPNNVRDEAAVVFVDNIAGAVGVLSDIMVAANVIVHEGGHTLGLIHNEDPTTQPMQPNAGMLTNELLLSRGSLMDSGAFRDRSVVNMITRFDLLLQNPPAGTGNDYVKMANDPDLGLRDSNGNGRPDLAYVTGTGAHDRIRLSIAGPNLIQVDVDAFSDAARTMLIRSNNYTINLTTETEGLILVDAGFSNDEIIIDGDLGVAIQIRGLRDTDSLIVRNGNVATATYVPDATAPSLLGQANSFGGQLIYGGTTINFSEFEVAGSVLVQNAALLTVRTPNSVDAVSIQTGTTGAQRTRITGSSGVTAFVPIEFSQVTSVVLDTATNDGAGGNDVVDLDAALTAAGLQNFTIETGNGSDRLDINTSNISLPVAGGTFAFNGGTGGVDTLDFTTASSTAVTYTPDGFNDPSRGSLTFGGASMTFTGLEFVEPVTPVINGIAIDLSVINEGDSVRLTGTFLDPGSLSTHSVSVNWGDGNSTSTPLATGARSFSIDYTYPDDNPTGTPFDLNNIQVTLTDNDSLSDSDATSITVHNLDPVITAFASDATFEEKAMEGEPVNVVASFTDVGVEDTHTAIIDWGDGSAPEMVTLIQGAGFGTVQGTHTYTAGGIYTITLTLTDDDTGVAVETTTAVVSGVGLNNGTLFIIGTSLDNHVSVNQTGGGLIKVHADFVPEPFRTFNLADINQIVSYLCEGDDHLTMAGKLATPAVIHGDAGDDHLHGGGGPTVLIGGAGNDRLVGQNGGNILIGGIGSDRLTGGNSDDVLIGGNIAAEGDDAALLAAAVAWNDAGMSYANRVVAIQAMLTVIDDGEQDSMTGSSGQDLFYLGIDDEANDRKNNETILA